MYGLFSRLHGYMRFTISSIYILAFGSYVIKTAMKQIVRTLQTYGEGSDGVGGESGQFGILHNSVHIFISLSVHSKHSHINALSANVVRRQIDSELFVGLDPLRTSCLHWSRQNHNNGVFVNHVYIINSGL